MDSIRTDPQATVVAAMKAAKRHGFPSGSMPNRLTKFWFWLQYRQCYIRDIHEKTIPLIPNRAQYMLLALWFTQALVGRPLRTVILKSRKVGITTFIQAWSYFNCRFFRSQEAVMMAHRGGDTEKIFNIARTIGLHDQISDRPKVGRQMLTFGNLSSYSCCTAGGDSAGAGGTPNLLHRSELALWPRAKKVESDYTAGNAVPKTPTSCICDESTARGQDLFWGRFRAAQRKDHPFERLFVPWFVDDTLKTDLPTTFVIDDDESRIVRRGVEEYGINVKLEALQWRREKIQELGSVELFKQEYPSTAEEAIQSRRGLVVPGLAECLIDVLPFKTAYMPSHDKSGGYDYGFNDPTVLIASFYRDQVLYVFRVYRCTGKLARDYAGEIVPGHTYHCDPTDPGVIEAISRAGRQSGAIFRPAPRAVGTRERAMVKHEWDTMKGWVLDGRIKILQSCSEQLIIEADSLEWDEARQEPDMTRTAECGHFDTLCALRYNVMGCAVGGQTIKRRARKHRDRADLRRV